MRLQQAFLLVCAACVLVVAAQPKEPGKAVDGPNNAAQQDSEGDCAEPNRARYDVKLAEDADLVVSGLAVSMGPGTPVCAGSSTSGPDLLVEDGEQEDGSQVLLFWVQCVHKGALVCRRNEADNTAKPPRCMIAVKVPAQAAAPGQLPPCTVTRGLRYTLLLSNKAAARCDGAYSMQYPTITSSIRTHIGVQSCAPYPTWPSQDTSTNGTGLAGVLAQSCDGAADTTARRCTGDNDPCTTQASCSDETAVTCVAKACTGKYMVNNGLISAEPCQPVFISKVTGLPVESCSITKQRLDRQARQSEKRLSRGIDTAGSGSDGGPTPQRLGSVLGGGSRLEPLPELSGAADALVADVNSLDP